MYIRGEQVDIRDLIESKSHGFEWFMDNVINETTERMKKAVESFHHELSKLRTGRASLTLLDDVKVEYYGQISPLNQVGTLAVPDPRTITIQPWDTTAAQAIAPIPIPYG